MKSKEELKKLFENGDKPTQEEFWEWQDSYWHKGEKLPIETGLYKIKGSVPDKTALDTMTSMEEGDVYNLLDTGENYVYVLDLDSTGSAGWDKLSGIVDLSTVNLQTVLDNGGTASINEDGWYAFYSLAQGGFQVLFNANGNTSFLGMSAGTGKTTLNRNEKEVTMDDSALTYKDDYSADFTDRSLVDKAYVDSKVSPANLQSVLENGSQAIDYDTGNFISMNLVGGGSEQNYNNPSTGAIGIFSNSWGSNNINLKSPTKELSFLMNTENSKGIFRMSTLDRSDNKKTQVELKADQGLVYDNDYSADFVDRSLVDKAYVDNATLTLNYLPLSGTVAGNPLTGNIALSYTNFISGSGDYQSKLEFVADSSELYSITPMFRNSVRVSSDAVVLRSSNIASTGNYSEIYVREGLIRIATVEGGVAARGLTGDYDYTANITALDYVQKKYVDDAIANFTTPIEEIVLAGSNGLTGKIRYEKRGEFMNIHVDITVGELQVDESFSTILPFDLKTSFIVHPMITDIVNYFYTDIIIKTDGNDLLFINKTDAVITGGLIKQSFVFALGAD